MGERRERPARVKCATDRRAVDLLRLVSFGFVDALPVFARHFVRMGSLISRASFRIVVRLSRFCLSLGASSAMSRKIQPRPRDKAPLSEPLRSVPRWFPGWLFRVWVRTPSAIWVISMAPRIGALRPVAFSDELRRQL